MAVDLSHRLGDQQSPRRKANRLVRGANDNAPAGEACVTDVGAALPAPSITTEELEILKPVIEALARMAAKRVSATTSSSTES